MRKLTYTILAIALMINITACGSSSSSYTTDSAINISNADSAGVSLGVVSGAGENTKSDGYYNLDTDEWVDEDSSNQDNQASNNQDQQDQSETTSKAAEDNIVEKKLVYRCDINIETLTFNETYEAIKTNLDKVKGIVQSESQSNDDFEWYVTDRYSDNYKMHSIINCRIPSEKYNEFIEAISSLGDNAKVMSKSTSVDNISQEYYDTTAQLEVLKIQEQRLLDMMNKADTIEDMISVEKRLTDVQSQINSLTNNIKYMDSDVAYSYVNITLDEVKDYSETYKDTDTFKARLIKTVKDTWDNFKDGLEETVFSIIRAIPTIAILIVVFIVYKVIKLIRRKDNKKITKAEEKELLNYSEQAKNSEE